MNEFIALQFYRLETPHMFWFYAIFPGFWPKVQMTQPPVFINIIVASIGGAVARGLMPRSFFYHLSHA
jgi:hypothetical protein